LTAGLLSLIYLRNIVSPRELKRNRTANAMLNLENSPSKPLAALPKNCSPAPVIDPDKPALLPDCKRTVAINPIELILKTIMINMVMFSPPLKA
jgi:hypothetical protein